MKKTISVLLAFVSLCAMTACQKDITIEPSQKVLDIQAKYELLQEEPEIFYDEYDNELSAKDLPKRSEAKVSKEYHLHEYQGFTPNAWFDRSYSNLETSGCGGVMRNNFGKAYSVTRFDNGKYLFVYFGEGNKAMDSCYISCLSDVSVKEKISVGMTLKEINRLAKGNSYYTLDRSAGGFYYFSDLSCVHVIFEKKGKDYVAIELVEMEPENSVLTYLLPQDLALIS